MKCCFLILLILTLTFVQCHPFDDPDNGGMTLDTCLDKLRQTRRQVERAYRAHLSQHTPDAEREIVIANLQAQVAFQRGQIAYLENKPPANHVCSDSEDFAVLLQYLESIRELESQFSTQQSYIFDLEKRGPDGHICPDQEAFTAVAAQVDHQRNYIHDLEKTIDHLRKQLEEK